MLTFITLSLTALVLGLFTGSLLTEGVILIPYWRSMEPKVFLNLHGSLGPQLYKYFAPLTIAAILFPIIAAIHCVWIRSGAMAYSLLSAVLSLCILVIYFHYFKSANDSFATGSVGVEGLPDELRKWNTWHWIRTIVAIAAFYLSLVAIAQAGIAP